MSEIKEEKMHVDLYTENVLRIFVNIDNTYRTWKTTTEKQGYKRAPKHEIDFAPGTLWCCETKGIPHQIIYGARAALFSFK